MNNDIQNDRLCNQYGIVNSETKWFVNIPPDNQVLQQFDKNFMECGKRSTHNDFYITTLPQNTSIFHGSSALTENLILVPTGIKYDDSIRDNEEIKPRLLLDTENDNILEELEKYGSISPAWFTSVEAADLYGGSGENKCGVKKLTTISDEYGTYTVNTNQCILAFKTKKDVKLIMLDNVYNFVKIYNYIISMSEQEFNKLYERIQKEIKNSPKPQEYFQNIPTNNKDFANMYTYFFTGPLTEDFSTDYTVDSGFFQNYGIGYDKQSSSSESRFYLYDKLNGNQRVPYVPRFSVTNYDLPLSIFFCYLAEKFDCDGFAVNETRRSTNYEDFYNNRPASVQEKMIKPTIPHHVEISLCKVHKNLYRDYNNPLDWQYKASNNIDVPYHVKKYITLLNTKFLNVNYEEYAGSYYENTVWATLFTEFLFTQNGPLLKPKLSNNQSKDKILKNIHTPLTEILSYIQTFIGIDEDKKNLERFSKICTCMTFLHNFRQIMGDDTYCNNKNDKRRCVQNDTFDVESSEFLSYSLIESVYTNSFDMPEKEYKEDMKLVRLYFDSYLETSSLFNQLLSLISEGQNVSELVKKIFDKLIKYLVYKYYLIFHIDKMDNKQIQKIDNMVLGVFLSCYIVSFSIYNTKNSFNHIVNINNDQRAKINLFYNGVIETIDNSINLQSSIIPGISNISKNYPGSQIDDREIINQIKRQLIFIKNFMVTKNNKETLFAYTLINEENNRIARDNLKNNIYNRLVQSIFNKVYEPTLKMFSKMKEKPTEDFTAKMEKQFRAKSDLSFLKSGKISYDGAVKRQIEDELMVDDDSLFPEIIDSKYIFEFSDKLRTRQYVLTKLNYESVEIDTQFTSLYEIYSAQLYTKYINNVTQRLFNETIGITDKQIRDVKGNPKDRILGLYNLIVKKVCSIICVEYSTNHYPHLITPLPRINHNVLNHIRSLWFSCLILMNKIQSEKYNNHDIVLIMISSFMKSINRISESGGDVKCYVNINDLLQIEEIKELKQKWPGLITENVGISTTALSSLCMHVQVLKTLSTKLDFETNCSEKYYNYVVFSTGAHSGSYNYDPDKGMHNFSCLINAPHYLDHCRFSTAFSQLDNNSMAMFGKQPNDLNSPSKWLTDYLNEVNMDNNVIKEYYHQQQLRCLTLSGLNVKDIKQITKNLPDRCRLSVMRERVYGDTFLEYCNNPTIALSEMFERNNFKLISEY